MKNDILKFIGRLLPFTLVIYIAHLAISIWMLDHIQFYYDPYAIYLFLFISTLLVYLLLLLVHKNFQDKTGFAFMGASFLKMLAALAFLLPMLLNNRGFAFPNLLAFFIPYFLFLIFETVYAVKLLNRK